MGRSSRSGDGSDGTVRWPMDGYDYANTGHNPSSADPRGTERERKRVHGQWQVPAPTVIDDTIYVGSDPFIYAIGLDHSRRWRYRTEGFIRHFAAAYDDGTIYAGAKDVVDRSLPGPGKLFAVDADTGALEWDVTVPISSEPVVSDGRIYFAEMIDDTAAVRSISTTDRSERWRRVVAGDEPSTLSFRAPVLSGDRLYVTSTSERESGWHSRLHALSTADGDVVWTAPVPGRVEAGPVLAGGTVYVASCEGRLHAIDFESGREEWTVEVDGAIQRRPVIVDDTACLPEQREDAKDRIVSVSLDDARIGWDVELEGRPHGLAATDETVFSADNGAIAIDIDTGEVRWRHEIPTELDHDAFGDVTVAGATLFLGACLKSKRSRYVYDNYVISIT